MAYEIKSENRRPRSADLGLKMGVLPKGKLNSITDVPGVKVGHTTLIEGDGDLQIGKGPIRTGVTAILPHDKNIYENNVIGSAHVINGYGKTIGIPQIKELGRIESPILLTGTLNAWKAADYLIDYLSEQNPGIRSFNPVVGECNDGFLNDIVGRHLKKSHVINAIDNASESEFSEGVVGAGTGLSGFDWKGGVGTSSRIVQTQFDRGTTAQGEFTIGCLTLTNTGEAPDLRFDGIPIGRHILPPTYEEERNPANWLGGDPLKGTFQRKEPPGSIMIVIATDAPLSGRQLNRLAKRAGLGLGLAGGIATHSSGDFVIAFSNAEYNKNKTGDDKYKISKLSDNNLSNLFRGVIETTNEAIINSILKAETVVGINGNTRHAIPIEKVIPILEQSKATMK